MVICSLRRSFLAISHLIWLARKPNFPPRVNILTCTKGLYTYIYTPIYVFYDLESICRPYIRIYTPIYVSNDLETDPTTIILVGS
jgi:hypothetical protein